MMRSLFSGVSGLKSHQTRMDVIGNNIANINTVGFKSSRTTFSDMLSQTTKGAAASTTRLGGTNPLQIGLGTSVASIDLITSDGSPQSTGKNTDVALSGNGMFVLKNGDQYFYTRDGAFEFDEAGNYVLPGSGNYVQGWNAIDGSLNTNSDPTNIVVPAGRAMEATATSTVDFSGNLNASSPTIESISYTQGGAGADPSLCVGSDSVGGISYTYSFTKTYTGVTPANTTFQLGTDGTSAGGGYQGSITGIALTFTDDTSGEGVAGTPYAVGGDVDGKTIASITVTYSGTASIDSSDTNTYARNQVLETAGATPDVIARVAANGNVTPTITESYTETGKSVVFGTTQVTSGPYTGTLSTAVITYVDANGVAGSVTGVTTGTYEIGSDTTDLTGDSVTVTGINNAVFTSTTITPATGVTVNNGDVLYTDSPTTINSLSLTLNKSGTSETTTEQITSGSKGYAIGDLYGEAESVNVDGKNVIAAVLTLSDGTTQKVTSGFYQVGHSIPITTIVTLYDSEGKTHAVTVLLDKDRVSDDENANTDAQALGVDNRWRVYVAPPKGVKEFTQQITDTSSSITLGMSTATNSDGNVGVAKSITLTLSDGIAVTIAETDTTSSTAYKLNDKYPDESATTTISAMTVTYARDGHGPATSFITGEEDGSSTYGTFNNGLPSYIYFNTDGSYSTSASQSGSLYLSYANGNGAEPTTASVDFTGLTQFAGSSTAYPTADGNSYGVLQSVSIDSSGILTGTYTNGTRRFEAQLAVAQFINPAGLTKTGTSLYQASNNSGAANVKTVTDLGLSITPSALEMSNVDLASELADMIVTQRGFQSNSKIISVGDEMLETLVNMKR